MPYVTLSKEAPTASSTVLPNLDLPPSPPSPLESYLGPSRGRPNMASLRLSSLARGVAASAVSRSSPVAVRAFSTSLAHHQDNPATTAGGKKPTFAHARRLKDGRALSLDVWSVFK